MAKKNFTFKGSEVHRKVIRASIAGVNQAMDIAVTRAKNNHAWTSRTGDAEGSIRVQETARQRGAGRVAGLWGSVDTPHVLYLEKGTKAHTITPRRAGGVLRFVKNGTVIYARKVKHPGTKAQPFLVPANEKAGRELKGLIRKEMKRL